MVDAEAQEPGATVSLRALVLAALSLLVLGGIQDGLGLDSVPDDTWRSGGDGAGVAAEQKAVALDAALDWVSSTAVGRRPACSGTCSVEAGVAGDDMRERSDAGVAVWGLRRSVVHTATQAIICSWACFRQGYRDFGGNPEWEDRFVDVIDTCESPGHEWNDVYPLYVSRAQFDPRSWATAADATTLADPANPYHVGANVAVWSRLIEHPGGSGGWPGCWQGVGP